MSAANKSTGQQELNEAYDGLEREVPDRIVRLIRWMRDPKQRSVRLSAGILLIVLSFFSFLPIIGIEFLPIGLLLIAQDVPFLRKPVARAFLWLEGKWVGLRQWWNGQDKAKERSPEMKSVIESKFRTRRDAEIAIEHLVQDEGIDRNDITILASGKENSAGSQAGGADVESRHPGVKKHGAPQLSGDIIVSVKCEEAKMETVKRVLADTSGTIN